jgi:small GTP-binding protein
MNTPKTTSFEGNLDKKFIGQSSQKICKTNLLLVFIIFSTIIILCRWIKRHQYRLRHHGTSLLLCGISNSGKTLLFNRLISNAYKQTTDSSTINHGIMILDYLSTDRPIKRVHVIDIPGDLRHHQHDFHAYKTSVKGIIFVIDSTTIEKDIKHVSDYLYDILHEKYFQNQRLPLLIFCNKQDLNKKHYNLQLIRQLLEDELTIKRKTKNDIGRLGKEIFEFNDIKDIRIEFVEGSVLSTGTKSIDNHNDSGSNLLRVHQWIARIWFK